MTVIPTKRLFQGSRTQGVPTTVPESLGTFPMGIETPADCQGDREGCAWNTPYHLLPQLPCRQRCQLGAEAPGGAAW